MDDNKYFLLFWNELTKNTANLIDYSRPITTGAENILGQWDMKKQYLHVMEEVMEAYNEYKEGDNGEDEIDEDMDILFTALTIFHKKSYSHQDIKFSISRLIRKYEIRGFIKFAEKN